MAAALAALNRLDFLSLVWLFPIAYALHEAEEWNILRWYQRHYADLPPMTNRSVRTFLVFASAVGFVCTVVATVPGNPRAAAFLLMPAVALALQNALQHVWFLLVFRDYAPGIITSVLLLVPVGAYLAARAVDQGYVPLWYVLGLAILIPPGLVQRARAGRRLTQQFRAIHGFGMGLSKWLWGGADGKND
jgi:hypothetical protein